MFACSLLAAFLGAAPAAQPAHTLPAVFDAGRVYVLPKTTRGQALKLYTDSGGGLFLTEAAVTRLGLPTEAAGGDASDLRLASLPAFAADAWIPAPAGDGKLRVMPAAQTPPGGDFVADGMLGEAWFAGRVWTFDYARATLTLEGADWHGDLHATRVPLGFKTDSGPNTAGARANAFPRITLHIDGAPLDVLLDTGATTELSDAALAAVHDGLPAARATSFIAATEFDAWHTAHPDWRVLEHAERRTDAAMIEVPAVEIGGATVGPVWFTRRPDKSFHEFMTSLMDAPVAGAIGGDALRHFRMTLDYPGAAAYFRCVAGCLPAERVPRIGR